MTTLLAMIANGCYRWLATRLNGFEKTAPKQLPIPWLGQRKIEFTYR